MDRINVPHSREDLQVEYYAMPITRSLHVHMSAAVQTLLAAETEGTFGSPFYERAILLAAKRGCGEVGLHTQIYPLYSSVLYIFKLALMYAMCSDEDTCVHH